MSSRYSDIIPANANIEIEYGKTDSVKFSYPISWTYRQAFFKRAYGTMFTFFILAFVKFFMLFLFAVVLPISIILAITKQYNIILWEQIIFSISKIFNYMDLILNIVMGYLVICITLPLLIGLNKKLVSYLMPKMGYYSITFFGRTKEKVFIPTDIENNKCIIPLFSNVFLNYNAIGDFSKYLKKVKIIAYDFHYHIRKRILFFVIHRDMRNDFSYYAVFEFTKKPLDGFLECEYY